MSKQPHLGCTLSLISKANIRYEGILKGIDTDACTLTLNNVQSFGTEDRTEKVIPPTPGTYDLIIFNGHDIQDVQVVEKADEHHDPAILNAQKRVQPSSSSSKQPPISKPVPTHTKIGHDANKSAFSKPNDRNKQPSDNNNRHNQNRAPGNQRNNNNNRSNQAAAAPAPQRQQQPPAQSAADALRNNNLFPKTQQGNAWGNNAAANKKRDAATEAANKKREEERAAAREAAEKKKKEEAEKRAAELEKIKQSDFDWTTGNKDFDKDKVAQELEKLAVKDKTKSERKKSKEDAKKEDDEKKKSSDGDKAEEGEKAADPAANGDAKADSDDGSLNSEPEVYYDSKKSFFDNISCEATEVRKRKFKKPMSRHEERKLNSETFGIPAYSDRNADGNNGGDRGGHRGRGGYRGRGNYRGNSNNYRGGMNGGGRGGYNNRGYNNRGGFRNNGNFRGAGGRGGNNFRRGDGRREFVNYDFDVNKARQSRNEM